MFSKHSQQMLSGAEVGTLGRPFQRLITNLLYLFQIQFSCVFGIIVLLELCPHLTLSCFIKVIKDVCYTIILPWRKNEIIYSPKRPLH